MTPRLLRPFLLALLLPASAAAQVPEPSPEEAAILAEEARLEAEEAAADEGTAIPGLAPGRLPPARDPAAPDPAPPHPELRPVFEAFGGEAGLSALMETFMHRLLADPRTEPFFADTEHERVKRQLVEQFCAILGGGCAYTGRDMRTAHAGLGIDRADFNALVEVLQASMDEHDIPFRHQNRLLAKLAPMHRDVVTE